MSQLAVVPHPSTPEISAENFQDKGYCFEFSPSTLSHALGIDYATSDALLESFGDDYLRFAEYDTKRWSAAERVTYSFVLRLHQLDTPMIVWGLLNTTDGCETQWLTIFCEPHRITVKPSGLSKAEPARFSAMGEEFYQLDRFYEEAPAEDIQAAIDRAKIYENFKLFVDQRCGYAAVLAAASLLAECNPRAAAQQRQSAFLAAIAAKGRMSQPRLGHDGSPQPTPLLGDDSTHAML